MKGKSRGESHGFAAAWPSVIMLTAAFATTGCSSGVPEGMGGAGGVDVGGLGGSGGATGEAEVIADEVHWPPGQVSAEVMAPSSNAMACTSNAQCSTGYCVDGFCCDTKCDNRCMACSAAKKGGGADGICGSVAYDTDPDGECPQGRCDGKNQCKFYNGYACTSAAQCLSNYCVDGFCCGNICMGACQACSAAKKGGGSNGVCGNIAAGANPDGECASGGTCNGSGACSTSITKLAHGAACTSAAQCNSGFCADGVCCDSWCLGTCQACTAARKGQGADGTCGNIANDRDPDEECWGGACDGKGVCKQYNGVPCANAANCLSGYCVDGFCCGNICTGVCQACSEAKKGQGFDGVCGAIMSGRDPDNECNPGECNGSGTCNQAQTPQANGVACVAAAQCASGNCVDGVCCNAACTGTCQACMAAKKGSGTSGTCGPIKYDTDPDEECFGGACSGTGACRQYNGFSCAGAADCLSNYCVDGFCCNNICTGTCQACSTAKKGSGANGACGLIAANADPDNECALSCNGTGACIKAPIGSTCSSAADCTSGFCADGYCCNSACAGACESCGIGGSEGTCANACPGACTTTLGLPFAPLASGITMSGDVWDLDAADFNADGLRDLVAVSGNGTGVSVLLGQSNGGFAAPSTLATASYPFFVAAADLNGDGKTDIVTRNESQGTVSVLLNQGNATFAPKVDYATGYLGALYYNYNIPNMLAIADLNGDGILDLCTADKANHTFSLLLGQGNGTFAAAVSLTMQHEPTAIAPGDFNADGKTDLAVTHYSSATSSYGVTVMMGQGGGAFGAGVHYSLGATGASSMIATDFNADGRLDLAVSYAASPSGYKVGVLLNQGNGTFASPVAYDVAGYSQVIAANLNGDAHVDLAVATGYRGTAQVLLGQGNGTFAVGPQYTVGNRSHALVAVDVDNDNDQDVATGNANSLAVLTNLGPGTFGRAVDSDPKLAMDTYNLLNTDINADGKLDLIGVDAAGVEVAFGQGNGNFGTIIESPWASSAFPADAKLADLNGDGKQDLVASTFSSIRVRLSQGNGTFAPETEYPAYDDPSDTVVGDFNNDGKIDVATGSVKVTLVNASQSIYNFNVVLSVWYGTGNGLLGTRQDTSVGSYSDYSAGYNYKCTLAAGDMNGDGRLDFAISGQDYWTVGFLLNQSGGQFGFTQNGGLRNIRELLFTDLNGDGLVDLVGVPNNAALRVWLNNGAGSVVFASDYGSAGDRFGLIAVDMNGDGAKDVALANQAGSSATVMLNQGNGVFGGPLDYVAGLAPGRVTAGDWNGDGRMDLAVENQTSKNVTLMRGTCLP